MKFRYSLSMFSILLLLAIAGFNMRSATAEESSTAATVTRLSAAQQAQLMEATTQGYAKFEETFPIKIKITNTGINTDITSVEMTVPLPDNAVHVSGGTFDADTRNVTITSGALAVDQSTTLTVQIKSTASGDNQGQMVVSQISGKLHVSGGFYPVETGDPFAQIVLLKPATSTEATYAVDGTAFDPATDGYGFQNYGNENTRTWQDDLGDADAFILFGADACATGDTAETCKMKANVKTWMENELNGMNGGHCYGMASTAARIFEGLSYQGKTSPSDFEAGKDTTFALTFGQQPIENYVADYFVRQSFPSSAANVLQPSSPTPKDVLTELTNGFNNSSEGYILVIFKMVNGSASEGHAITPIGVEKVDDDISYIVVYDNNFPGEKRYVSVNTTDNTWEYIAAASPGQTPDTYAGDATTKSLSYTKISAQDPDQSHFPCNICASGSRADGDIEVRFTGEGAMLVIDDQDRKIGTDFFNDDMFVNDIPGASQRVRAYGPGYNVPPDYIVPYLSSDGLYQIWVSGKTLDEPTDGDLTITGNGFILGLDFIQLAPNEALRLDVSPDGNEIYFEALSDEPVLAPAMFIALDPLTEGEPSIEFFIDSLMLDPGEVVYIGIDEANGYIHLEQAVGRAAREAAQTLDIDLYAVWPDGFDQTFHGIIDIPASATSAYIDYFAWDDRDGEPPLFIDGQPASYTTAPANLEVSTLVDELDSDHSDGDNSLREAIVNASDGDTITFDPSLSGGTITLAGTQLTVDKSVTISATVPISVSANSQSRVFLITQPAADPSRNGDPAVHIHGLTIRDGNQTDEDGICPGLACGGGIVVNSGTALTLTHSRVISNSATLGGGILNNSGTTSVTNSTLSANSARAGGGILNNSGTTSVTNSTLSTNSATNNGGGIYNDSGTTSVTNSTLSANSASQSGGGLSGSGGTLTIEHTLIANNTIGGDCTGTITSNDHNLDSDGSCGLNGTNDLSNTNPLLAPLADYGGDTQTHALLLGSPALDAGGATCGVDSDQRGVARPQGSACDIGAFEGSAGQLLVTAFTYQADPADNSPTGNLDGFVVIKNMGDISHPLNGYQIGDEETKGDDEGMFALPDIMLPAGSQLIIAEDADNYPYVGTPDYSFATNNVGVPTLTPYTDWSNGVFDLDNNEDEVVLIAAGVNFVDGACYGSPAGEACLLENEIADSMRATTPILIDGRLLDSNAAGFTRTGASDTHMQADWSLKATAVDLQSANTTTATVWVTTLLLGSLLFVTFRLVASHKRD